MSVTSQLEPEQIALRRMVADVAANRFAAQARAWDEAGVPIPDSERAFLADLGLLGITHPVEYGGSDRPLLDALIALEELAKASPAAAWPVFEACTGPARVIQLLGNQEQRQALLPPVIMGAATIAVSISEPDAGSAATDMRTTGRIDGERVIVDGVKRWCSGAGHAEQYLVYLRLSDARGASGIGAAVVDRDTPGLSFGPRENLMGFRSVPSADMVFDHVEVPLDRVIVPAGGFAALFRVFSIERLGNATMSLALAQTALDRTARYIRERHQFGRPIMDFQLVQHGLAEMVMRVEAARLLIYQAAEEAGRGTPSALAASIAKCTANEAAKTVTDLAIQMHGGYGYSQEFEIERLHRDAHGWALAGGTPNMQRLRIASEYLGVRFSHRSAQGLTSDAPLSAVPAEPTAADLTQTVTGTPLSPAPHGELR
jgi:alkylation response protein AidB-like acyl-CoA dehydrogenase